MSSARASHRALTGTTESGLRTGAARAAVHICPSEAQRRFLNFGATFYSGARADRQIGLGVYARARGSAVCRGLPAFTGIWERRSAQLFTVASLSRRLVGHRPSVSAEHRGPRSRCAGWKLHLGRRGAAGVVWASAILKARGCITDTQRNFNRAAVQRCILVQVARSLSPNPPAAGIGNADVSGLR